MEEVTLKNNQPGGNRGSRIAVWVLTFAFLAAGIIAGVCCRKEGATRNDARKFERVLHGKELFLQREFEELDAEFAEYAPVEVLHDRSPEYQELGTSEGISIFYYENEILRYWSDHAVPVTGRWRQRYGRPFVPMSNADYVSVTRNTKGGLLLGLIEIRTHFPFQNRFLENRYQQDFTLDPGVDIAILEENGTEPVFNAAGTYLFSLDFSEAEPVNRGMKAVSVIFLFLFVVFGFMGICMIIRRSAGATRWIWMSAATLLLVAGALSIMHFGFPRLITSTRLFQPELFAGRLFPSLGNLMVLTLLALFLATLCYLYGNLERIRHNFLREGTAVLLFAGATLVLLFIEHLITILVLDSNISFEAHNVTTFSLYTLVGLLIIIIWFILLGLMLDKAMMMLRDDMAKVVFLGILTVSLTMLLVTVLSVHHGNWLAWGAIMLLLGAHIYLRYRQPARPPFSRFIFLVLVISVFMVVRLQQNNGIKVERQREVELVKLSSEHDPVAEMLFSELSMAIRSDTILSMFLDRPHIDIDRIFERIQRNYFYGYWSKYDLQVTVCRPDDRVYLQPPDDVWLHCYSFFDEMILQNGIQVDNSDFYFLDNLNGRISYLAAIPFFGDIGEKRVFIELDSKIISEELGYPELLLDKSYSAFTSSKFSYAKYNSGELITRDGEYPYRRSSDYYTSGLETFEQITVNRYDHSIYNVNPQNTIIVGSPSVTLVDNLISFSYIFALNFMVLALFSLFASMRSFRLSFNWNFKNKIQYSMAGILFLTFLLICSGTILFVVRQYRVQHDDNLRNTMRSIYIELIHKVEFEEDLVNWSSEDYYNLDELLRKFSNVFYTDINLYDQAGNLLATSRAEIFDRQLLSRRMNRLVYEKLAWENVSEYIHSEHIGEMRYISAYIPLLNSNNKFLAYLNLPYFTQSGELTKDITNLVVAVINVYLILLIVILLLSVFLADRITQPLRMIQQRIAQVSLSEKNEKIRYDRSDEIRGLVEEYNYMVEELERSAQLLAQSERESAWREMAKQIAHEIKNPLTPMKLNVQHLLRTVEEKKQDPEMIRKISVTLIEQIDSLSSIAREFSDFAKMPRAKNEKINLVAKLRNLQQLFESSERATISLELGDHREVPVYGDKEQLLRIFINLVKNGLQSIPEGREGVITIRLEVTPGSTAIVTIRDNGKGIPEEIRDRLFQPNFTTKSGGMGMGLAISNNIVKSFGGRIWYDTVMEKGTTFYVELPLVKETLR
ncbi:MAG TPA: HAMP domain-containing protein [Bacteroides sp.]|nr:HAMP domain-containing protein [Bacteroides sp.]